MKKITDLVYSKEFPAIQTVDIHTPEKPKATFIYFHGGGLDRGNKLGAEKYATYLCERDIAIASVNYRLYANPNYPDRPYTPAKYPDFIRDASKAVAFVKKYMKENFNQDKIYVGGSSAGGYLSMMLCFDRKWLEEVGLSNNDIAGYLHDAGQPTAHFKILSERGFDSRRTIVDETSPLYYVGVEDSYPPMRFLVSDSDIKNRLEQTMLVLGTMSKFGYTGYDHVIIHGTHVAYTKSMDEDGYSPFGKLIFNFIEKVEKGEYILSPKIEEVLDR